MEQDDLLARLRSVLAASSLKDAVLRAAQLTTLLATEVPHGNHLFIGKSPATAMRLMIPEIEGLNEDEWQWLVQRPHPWRRQLWIKGRKLLASTVWLDALTNGLEYQQAAENWNLPLAVAEEVFEYCSTHRDLIETEADEERQRLRQADLDVDAKVVE